MDLDSIKDYIPYASEMDTSKIKVDILPGRDEQVNGIWFFFHDEEETKKVVNELFYGITTESNNETKEED